jgi:general secretion pathway protein B
MLVWPSFNPLKEENKDALDKKQVAAHAVKKPAPGNASDRHPTEMASGDAGKGRAPSAKPSQAKGVPKAVAKNTPQEDRVSQPVATAEVKRTRNESKPDPKRIASSMDDNEPHRSVAPSRAGDSHEKALPPEASDGTEALDTLETDPPPPPPRDEVAEKAKPAAKKPIPLVSELPDEIKEPLGGLKINVHVYSEDPKERLVFINMRNRKVGERIGETGPILKEITPDGVIIDYGEGLALLKVGR